MHLNTKYIDLFKYFCKYQIPSKYQPIKSINILFKMNYILDRIFCSIIHAGCQ